jgi:hypothetical protein
LADQSKIDVTFQCEWISANPRAVTVEKYGVGTPHANGDTMITATSFFNGQVQTAAAWIRVGLQYHA